MAPIHDTDLAEERWSKAEWEHYELWEKIENRLRRKKLAWIGLTVFVFLLLSSIPILVDRSWKWKALSMARELGQQLGQMKREAGVSRAAHRIRFAGSGSLYFAIEKGASCDATGPGAWSPVRSGIIGAVGSAGDREPMLSLLSGAQGKDLDLPGLVESFCYDPLKGYPGADLAGFGFIPVKDLAEQRSDRVSLLVLKGPSAEISFE